MQALHPWRYPTAYELHYSETWRPQFEAFIHNGTSGFEPLTGGLDSEMAAAITLINHRGVGLWGASANSVLPSVPEKDYAHSIQSDAHWAVSLADSMPVYTILNLCRCLAYMQDKAIFSKEEGGVWALTHLPAGWAPVVRKALALYRGEQTEAGFAKGDLRAFTSGVLRHIDRLVEKEYPINPQQP
jgi:streptomycin 3"-adenylyltransferase